MQDGKGGSSHNVFWSTSIISMVMQNEVYVVDNYLLFGWQYIINMEGSSLKGYKIRGITEMIWNK